MKPRDGGEGRAKGARGRVAALLVAAAVGVGMSGGAWGQVGVNVDEGGKAQTRAMRAPPLAKSVRRLIEAEYQSEESAREVRLFHGLWRASDLNTAPRIATAALMSGAVDDPALQLPEVDVVDRAEAAMLRGELQDAINLLDIARARERAKTPVPSGGAPGAVIGESMRAVRIRARAHELLGEPAKAVEAAEGVTASVLVSAKLEAAEVVEAVRALAIATRIKGPAAAGSGADYQALMQTLDRVINEQDRLFWPARLAQAELLYEKDNPGEAGKALQEVLSLNPSCAAAWAMLGQMSVDAFSFDQMESIAGRLDLLGSGRGGDHDPAEGEEGDGNGGVSVYAGVIRARGMLRQVEAEAAIAALKPVLDRYPGQREAMAVRCAAEAIRFEVAGTDRMLAAFDEVSPGSALALFEVGKALSEARQYAMAVTYLERAHERAPKWAEPLIDRGLMEVQWGRIEEALPVLEKAVAIDPFNLRADNTLKLVRELLTYAKVESEHFVVRYKPGVDEVLARDMLGPLEELYEVVTGDEAGGMDHEPRVKTHIDLMPDHRWFGVRIAGMPAIHTIAASTGSCIAMEAPREGKGHQGSYDWIRVVRHEFVHTVSLDRTNNRIPHWFTEAAAVYLELAPRDYSTCQLLARALETETLFDFSEINSAFVRPKKPTDRAQAYAQGHWMYEYIVRTWGKRAPLDLMDLYAQGQREEQAYVSVLGISREEFLTRFKEWAKGEVITWGMGLEAGTPSVKELLEEEARGGAEGAKAEGAGGDEGNAGALEGAVAVGEPRELPEPTAEMVERWLEAYPEHPDVLELAVRFALKGAPNKTATVEMIPLLERYAKARPVDPLPHQQLARLYVARADGLGEDAGAKAIEHLEWLDAREQKTATYAVELARRYAAAGDWKRGWTKAERATQVSPYEAGHRELAATVAVKRGDFGAAERHLVALTMLEPSVGLHQQRLEALRKKKAGR